MKNIIQLFVVGLCVLGTLITLYFILTNEISFHDEDFAKYYGVLTIIGAISFIVLTHNDDNEETDPEKEKIKKS